MAIFSVNRRLSQVRKFEDIWNHYRKSGFLYAAKLDRMHSFLSRATASLDALLSAPSEFFQLHFAEEQAFIVSSLAGFRDTASTFVIEHAVSDGRPDLMMQCLLSMATAVSRTGVDFSSMFYSPENRWPSRLTQRLAAYFPDQAVSNVCYDYALADWSCRPNCPTTIQATGSPDRTEKILSAWMPNPRIASLGLDKLDRSGAWKMKVDHTIRRTQRMVHAFWNGEHIGCMLYWESPAILNYSHLCTRAEIYVDPSHPAREEAVQYLAARAWALASEAGRESLVVLLPAEADMKACVQGFTFPDKQYACFTWPAKGADGLSTTERVLHDWYASLVSRMQHKRAA